MTASAQSHIPMRHAIPDPDKPTLLTKQDCGKCDYVKNRIPENIDLQIYDIATVDGTAIAAYHQVLDKFLPVLIVDGEIVEGAIKIKNRIRELGVRQ